MKEFLSHAGVPFVERNVGTDLTAYKDLLARGFRTVPVTIIGEGESAVSITGFDEAALQSAVQPSVNR